MQYVEEVRRSATNRAGVSAGGGRGIPLLRRGAAKRRGGSADAVDTLCIIRVKALSLGALVSLW